MVVSDDLPWARRQFSNSSYQVSSGHHLNLEKSANQVEFLGHTAVTPNDIKRLTSFLFQSYCTATSHYGLRRGRESMAKLSLCSHTRNHQSIFAALFELLMSNICQRKTMYGFSSGVENLIKITKSIKDAVKQGSFVG